MSAGATDGSRLRNAEIPVYGVSGLFVEFGENRMHGRDERLAVKCVLRGRGVPRPAGARRWRTSEIARKSLIPL